jgi:hypothetical protein
MATHDYVIDNQTAPNFRADLNSALQAIVTQNSSGTAPSVTYANMIWYDSANNQLKKRDEANSSWITLGTIDEGTGTFTPSVMGGLATTAEIQSLSGTNKLPTTAGIATAAVLDTPSGASNWTPDWSAFISATWVITANRTLLNPTNVIPGTTRVVRIASSTSTARTISYGSNFKGTLPASVTNTAVALLTLYAVSSTEIVVAGVGYTA